MRIKLDLNACSGCGSCSAICPDFFELGDDGKSHIVGGKKEEDIEVKEVEEADCASDAEASCPERAISVS